MSTHELGTHIENTLARIEMWLEETCNDLDFARTQDGVLEVEDEDGGTVIISRHAQKGEIWIAMRTGAYHYAWDGEAWRDTRHQTELFSFLAQHFLQK